MVEEEHDIILSKYVYSYQNLKNYIFMNQMFSFFWIGLLLITFYKIFIQIINKNFQAEWMENLNEYSGVRDFIHSIKLQSFGLQSKMLSYYLLGAKVFFIHIHSSPAPR